MKLFSILFLMTMSFSASASEEGYRRINCTERPGGIMCNQITSLNTLYSYNCQGATCYSLWRNQANNLNTLINWIDKNVIKTDKIANDVGTLAHLLATNICTTSRTGVNQDAYDAVFAENTILPTLYDFQLRAGIHPSQAKTCSIEIRNR